MNMQARGGARVRAVQEELDLAPDALAAAEADPLIVALEGYEGPLHVLLALARSQKVDLLRLSISLLAEQYLAFVRTAARLRFTLAADYLVMAAWLTFLKSRLLLPQAPRVDLEAPPEEEAATLAFRLAKLDAMRRAAEALAARPRLRRDVFPRGEVEACAVVSRHRLEGDLHGLMTTYVEVRVRARKPVYSPPSFPAWRLDDARERLRSRLPRLRDWTDLADAAPHRGPGGEGESRWRVSGLASTLSAALELTREGELELRQAAPFAAIQLRRARGAAVAEEGMGAER